MSTVTVVRESSARFQRVREWAIGSISDEAWSKVSAVIVGRLLLTGIAVAAVVVRLS